MRYITTIGMLGAALMLPATGANAQQPPGQAVSSSSWPTPGIYLDVRGGGTFVNESSQTGAGITSNIVIDAEFDPSLMLEAGIGYDHPATGWRGEFAVGYRTSGIDRLTIANDGGVGVALGVGSLNGISSSSVSGDVGALSIMFNGYYDFDIDGRITPFVGAGVGAATIDSKAYALGVKIVDDDDSVFAYQGTAGIACEISSFWTASAAYTYFATGDPDFVDTAGGRFESEYDSHNICVGLRLTNF